MSFLTSIYSLGNIMDGVDIEDLTIEQYLELTQENHAPSVGIKVDDMTIAEYLEYEETIKTQYYDDYQPHSAKADVTPAIGEILSITIPYSPKTTKTPSKHTRENEVIKEQEQSDQGLDLGGTVNIMSKSVLEELSLADPKNANIIVEMADKTRGGIPDKKLKHYCKSKNDDDRIGLEWEGLSCTNWVRVRYGKEDPEKCGETKTRAIIRAMINKLPEEWFSGVSRDKDDLEGIIDYLEPTLYDGFIDHNSEACK
ncbi:hypothetical protein Tco_0896988 [Tanacetum coccineum]